MAKEICDKCLSYDVCEFTGNQTIDECEYLKSEADFVKVVRCRECKYYKIFKGLGSWCHRRIRSNIEYKTKPDDFCSYGTPQKEG